MIIQATTRTSLIVVLASEEVWREHFKHLFPRGGRTLEVMRLVLLGKSTTEISKLLKINCKTTSTYKARIKDAFYMESDAEFGVYAHHYGLARLEEVKE